MTPRITPWPWLAALVLLTGCGGGSSSDTPAATEPAPALAADLSSIDVRNAAGEMLVRHEFVTDSASQESVYTAQNAGTDGLWGTTDDVRTVHLTCSYTSGAAMDKRLLEAGWFDWSQLSTASPSLCWLRKPVAGKMDVAQEGIFQTINTLSGYMSMAGSPTGQILLGVLGIPISGTRVNAASPSGSQSLRQPQAGLTISTDPSLNVMYIPTSTSFSLEVRPDGSLRFCRNDCALVFDYQPTNPPQNCTNTSTNLNATGLDNIVYNPYADLPYTPHSEYSGTHYLAQFQEGRLHTFAYSSDILQPAGHEDRYNRIHYAADGRLTRIDAIISHGTDCRWYTDDDILGGYTLQTATAYGWSRVHYNDKGADATWFTADDQIARTLTVTRTATGRVSEVRVCSATGPDTVWQTPDDVCQTATLHYAAAGGA